MPFSFITHDEFKQGKNNYLHLARQIGQGGSCSCWRLKMVMLMKILNYNWSTPNDLGCVVLCLVGLCWVELSSKQSKQIETYYHCDVNIRGAIKCNMHCNMHYLFLLAFILIKLLCIHVCVCIKMTNEYLGWIDIRMCVSTYVC